jgi:hypothetical protein
MSRYGDRNVIARGVILWDGVTRPEQKDDGKGGHRTQFSIKIAMMNTQPEVAEIGAICTDALNASSFKGRMPANGCWPLLPIDAADFEGKLPNHIAFNAKTYRTPQVFDINKQEIAPMAYNQMLYPGCMVDVLVSAFAFDNKSKGIALSLDGIMIVDATAPRLPVGVGVDAAAAFGGGQPVGQASLPGQPVYIPPPTMAPAGQMVYTPPVMPTTPAPEYLNPPVPGQAAPPQPPPPVAPVKQMTALAGGQSYEAFIAAGWNDQQLVANGYMTA